MTLIVGIDVSSYQTSTFDTAGLAFCIVKATESTSYVNPEYTAQVAHARGAGLVIGHYHYATGTDSEAEVTYFAAHAAVQPGDIIALDWEETSVTPAARDAWLLVAKARFPHNRVVLYCSVNFWQTLDTEHYAADGLWVADYSAPAGSPRIAQPWVFHQYSSANGMDHNVAAFSSKAALSTWCNGLMPAPVAPTEEDDMSTPAVNGWVGITWPTGTKHVVQVGFDTMGGNQPKLRVVLYLPTGPVILADAWAPTYASKALEFPAATIADAYYIELQPVDGYSGRYAATVA